MLKKLCSLCAVSGNEKEVRDYIIEKITPYVSNIETDTMGNVIAFKKGTKDTDFKFMVCAHMDEVGFIVSQITDDGFIKFKSVGGIDDRILLTQSVKIGDVCGVIGIKAVHLQSKDERKKVVKMKNMYIDIGAKNKKEAEKQVKIGDYIAFDTEYEEFGDGFIVSKALDDRVGCYMLLEAIKKTYESDIYFCFTVQEEVGLRGAKVLSHKLNADASIVCECTTALDIPHTDEHEMVTHLGDGVALTIIDRSTICTKSLNDFIMKNADEKGIKYQIKQAAKGGNDAGAISIFGGGCETACLSVPSRNIHSPCCVVKKSDVISATNLLITSLENINNYTPTVKENLK